MPTSFRRRFRGVRIAASCLVVALPRLAHAADAPSPPAHAETVPSPVGADAAPPFASPGRVVTSLGGASYSSVGALGLGGLSVGPLTFASSMTTVSPPGDGTVGQSRTSVGFVPEVDVFVSRRVTLGGTLAVTGARSSYSTRTEGRTTTSESSTFSFALKPRVGLAFPLGKNVVFWPRVEIGPSYTRSQGSLTVPGDTWAVEGTLRAGFVVPVHARLAFDLGPSFTTTAAFSSTTTSAAGVVGAASVGGALGTTDVSFGLGFQGRLLLTF
ncbi:MAG: hypothetical protein U0169_21505 [Polyangiaceae bacterium]